MDKVVDLSADPAHSRKPSLAATKVSTSESPLTSLNTWTGCSLASTKKSRQACSHTGVTMHHSKVRH